MRARRNSAARAGLVAAPALELVAERLPLLRDYRWSSHRGYAGYGPALAWEWKEPLGWLCGGCGRAERRAALREYAGQAVRRGGVPCLENGGPGQTAVTIRHSPSMRV